MSLRYGALYIPAPSGPATQETTASLTVAPTITTSDTVEVSTTASVNVTPATAAEGERVAGFVTHETTAALTVAPATAAEGTAWRLTANDGTAATDVSGTWSTEASAWDDDPLTYATATGVGTHVLDITGYDFGSVVGSADTLVSVTVNVSGFCSDAARFAAPTVQAFDGVTAIGSPIALLERTSAGNEDVTIAGITLAQVRSVDFKIRYSVEQTS